MNNRCFALHATGVNYFLELRSSGVEISKIHVGQQWEGSVRVMVDSQCPSGS